MDQTGIETLIRNIDARTMRIEQRTTSIEERTAQIEGRTAQIEGRTAQIEERTTRIEERTAQIEERTTRIEEHTAQIEERTTRIEERTAQIEERTTRIEHILPTLATKEDLKAFATKDDVLEEGERTRRHFDMVASQMKADVALVAEGHRATREYVDGRLDESRAELKSLDKRIVKLEAKSMTTVAKPKGRSTRRDPS